MNPELSNGRESSFVPEPDDERRPTHRLRRSFDGYLEGESGVSFEALSRLAEPLYALYDLDPGMCFDPETCSPDELEASLAVLETARLLWAYFSHDRKDRARLRPQLMRRLLGEDADPEDRESFDLLLKEMEAHWRSFTPEEIARAEAVADRGPLSFDELTADAEPTPLTRTAEETPARFGPQRLELPDALALFARPMMETPEALRTPDALEDALTRASSYWELALAAPGEYSERLETIKRQHGRTPSEASRIEREARQMVARFYELFPERRVQASHP